jgi:hypothetical protein
MEGLITVEIFVVGDLLHPDFEMPILRRPVDELGLVTVPSKVCTLNQISTVDNG